MLGKHTIWDTWKSSTWKQYKWMYWWLVTWCWELYVISWKITASLFRLMSQQISPMSCQVAKWQFKKSFCCPRQAKIKMFYLPIWKQKAYLGRTVLAFVLMVYNQWLTLWQVLRLWLKRKRYTDTVVTLLSSQIGAGRKTLLEIFLNDEMKWKKALNDAIKMVNFIKQRLVHSGMF